MADLLKFSILITCLTFHLGAAEYGVHGQLFPINEEDLLEYIKRRLNTCDQNLVQEQVTRCFKNPAPVTGLLEATVPSVHYFDPTIVAKEDIKDSLGNIVILKGATYNPLVHLSLNQELLFLDGDKRDHLEFARSLGDQTKTKWILVKGNPFVLEEIYERPLFFDQHGVLVKKLQIKSIPSRVTQEGNRLKIESLPIQESLCDF